MQAHIQINHKRVFVFLCFYVKNLFVYIGISVEIQVMGSAAADAKIKNSADWGESK